MSAVDQDYEEAAELFRLAADAGAVGASGCFAEACRHLEGGNGDEATHSASAGSSTMLGGLPQQSSAPSTPATSGAA